jgi:radical SAM protein with 4Fe4S-binding SPASM domain
MNGPLGINVAEKQSAIHLIRPPDDFSRILVTIELAKQCNIYCKQCYIDPDERKADGRLLPLTVIDQLAKSKILTECDSLKLCVYGGEISVVNNDYVDAFMQGLRKEFPHAQFSLVSNFFKPRKGFAELYALHSEIMEVTFDFGRQTMMGDREKFLDSFKASIEYLTRIHSADSVFLNFPLNKATLDFGAQSAVDYFGSFDLPKGISLSLRFDHSVDFDRFRREGKPHDLISGYPKINPEIPYSSFVNYMKEVAQIRDKRGIDNLVIPLLDCKDYTLDDRFYSGIVSDTMLSISSYGDLTINPLFTSIPSAYLGNVLQTSIEEMVSSRKYKTLIRHERGRMMQCLSCDQFNNCGGGSVYLSKQDPFGGTECVGLKSLLDENHSTS